MTTITTPRTAADHVSAPAVSDHQQLLELDWATQRPMVGHQPQLHRC